MRKVLIIIRDLWKGFTVVILGAVLLIFSFLTPFHSFLPAWMHQDDSYIIKPRERRSFSIGLILGSIVRGMLVLSGGDGYIGFSVEDSSGEVIIAEKRVPDGYVFEFRPPKADAYIIVFDNDDSAEKSLYLTVWVYYYNILFLLLSATLFIAGIFTIIKEEKMQSSKVAATLEEAYKVIETSLNR